MSSPHFNPFADDTRANNPVRSGPLALAESLLNNNQGPKIYVREQTEAAETELILWTGGLRSLLQMWATIRVFEKEKRPTGKSDTFFTILYSCSHIRLPLREAIRLLLHLQ